MKILKIEACRYCPCAKYANGPAMDKFCSAHHDGYFGSKRRFTGDQLKIIDESRILDNCPLEDYEKETKKKAL